MSFEKDVEEPKNQDRKPLTLITLYLKNLFLNKSSLSVLIIAVDTFTFKVHLLVLSLLHAILKRCMMAHDCPFP